MFRLVNRTWYEIQHQEKSHHNALSQILPLQLLNQSQSQAETCKLHKTAYSGPHHYQLLLGPWVNFQDYIRSFSYELWAPDATELKCQWQQLTDYFHDGTPNLKQHSVNKSPSARGRIEIKHRSLPWNWVPGLSQKNATQGRIQQALSWGQYLQMESLNLS